MPAEVLRLHLAQKLQWPVGFFDAIHSASSPTTTPTAIIGISSASITTSTLASMLTTVSSPSVSTPQTLSLQSNTNFISIKQVHT